MFCARAVFAAAAGVNRRTLARDFWLVFSLFVCSVSRLVPRLPTYPFTLLPLQHRTPPQPRVYPVYIGDLAQAPQLGAVRVVARTARASHAS